MMPDTTTEMPSRPAAPGDRRRDFLRLAAWCALVLAAPLLILRDYGIQAVTPDATPAPVEKRRGSPDVGAETIDVQATIAEIREARPDYIGIGNSMMFTRLGKTPAAMNEITGRKFYFIYKSGSDTPMWFLTLKNIIAASGVRPKLVFFFIRDNELTTSYVGRDRDASPYLTSLRGRDEPELDAFMKKTAGQDVVVGRVDHWLGSMFSFPRQNEEMTRRVTDLAMDLGGAGMPKKELRFLLSDRFALDRLRGDAAGDQPVADALSLMTSSHEEGVKASLLPDMLRVAEKCGTRLLFFRVKKRPDAATQLPKEPGGMREYADFLGGWLGEHGALFFDESYDLSIHLDDYQEGSHIKPGRIDWYRRYFWQRMEGVFP